MKPLGLILKFHKWISVKNNQLDPVYILGAMLEALEISETVNSANLVTFIILYLGL
jgi:hypothetical protein